MAGFSEFHLKCVYFMSVMDVFSVGLAIPLLSPYLRSIGASHLIIGLSTSLYGAAQLFSSPLVGSWSDRHGRVSILSLSLAACSICYFLLGQTSSLVLILLLRLLLGCCKHTQSLCKSIIADEVPPYEQAGAYGKLAAISGLGFIVGPVIGGHIADHEHGFSFITMIILVCFWINIAVAQILPASHHTRNRRERHLGIQEEFYQMISHLTGIDWSKHKKILVLKLILVFTLSFYYNNFSIMLQEKYGMTPKSVGYIISFQSIIGSGTSFLSGQIQHIYEWRYPPQKASAVQIVHCFIAMTAGLVGVSFVDSTLGLLLALMPLASGAALLRTLLTELLVQKASPQERGSLLGASHSFSAMSRLTTPVIAGIASDWYGTSAVSSLSQIGATVGAIAAHRILKGEYLEHYVS
ncbi:major facilitator superfamily domain-containing protein 9 [Frankliniella occidentalis]|uniref:Major facilitator superfamily domain-containing protein 9 n=1 Tax=Frankliniella occidentalis TaxID=133901 RepID=A0A6J1SK30_FRAOC|nr:major facilitator superfamily domain-containing protein 9 [Frankliniella occidentalis]